MSGDHEGSGPDPGPVEAAVLAELERMDPAAKGHPLAALAVTLARQVDRAYLPAQAAQVAKELRATRAELVAAFPPAKAKDGLDELRERREQRGA